jgi:hypothetical protein
MLQWGRGRRAVAPHCLHDPRYETRSAAAGRVSVPSQVAPELGRELGSVIWPDASEWSSELMELDRRRRRCVPEGTPTASRTSSCQKQECVLLTKPPREVTSPGTVRNLDEDERLHPVSDPVSRVVPASRRAQSATVADPSAAVPLTTGPPTTAIVCIKTPSSGVFQHIQMLTASSERAIVFIETPLLGVFQ